MRKTNLLFLSAIMLLPGLPAVASPDGGTQQQTSQQQQTQQITGRVVDENGEPVVGATVTQKGTTNGAITDVEGNFKLRVPAGATIEVSYVGYKTKTMKAQPSMTISLASNEESLNEVVVVGYGTMKKANLTGAVDMTDSKTFEGRSSASVTQMLQGAIPNLNIDLGDGRPGRSASYNIRGTTSVGMGGSALILIDGVEGDPSFLNPDDIESVSVLKDAASATIYGARAPYGVVLITTKSANKGKPVINYSTNLSLQSPTNMPDYVTDGYVWAEHFATAYYNYNHSWPSGINKTQQFSKAWLDEYKRRHDAGEFGTVVSDGSWGLTKGRYVYFPEGEDYIHGLYKDHTFAQTHNVSLSGSDDKFDYYLSGRYYHFNGLYNSKTNKDTFTSYNTRLKAGYQVTPWLKISDNIEYSRNEFHLPRTYTEGTGNVLRNLADEGHPSSPMFNPDGSLTYSAVYSVGDMIYGQSYMNTINSNIKNTITAKATLLKNTLRLNADFTYRQRNRNSLRKLVPTPYSRYEGVTEYIHPLTTASIQSGNTRNEYLANNEYAEYENTFAKKHYFKGLLGFNYEQYMSDGTTASNDNLLTPDVENINLAMGVDNKKISGAWSKWKTVGFFTRLNYIFDDRYLLEFDARYDGSSKFPSDSRWAFFPSVSAGWRVSSEPWFKVDTKYLSNLKIRASYGSLGNGNISPYTYDEMFGISTGRIIDGTQVHYTTNPAVLAPGLTWETARTFDVGVDLAAFNSRLAVTFDWYSRKTLDMYSPGPTLPDVFGATSPRGNYADMTTKGYELSVAWRDHFDLAGKNFSYSLRATLSDYQSTIDKFNNADRSLGGTDNTPSTYYKGMKVGEIWGFVSNGLWQTEDEINAAESKAQAAGQKYYNPLMQTSKDYKLRPGDIKIEDLNGNGYIDRGNNTVDDPGDRRVIGNTTPRYQYSFSIDLQWNGIFLNTLFRGVGKQDWYPSSEASLFWGQYNRPYNQMPKWHLNNYWTEETPNAYLPRYTGYYKAFFSNSNANTRYLQSVAFCRLQNLQLGYNLPKSVISKLHIQKLAIFFDGENLFTWSPLYKRTKDLDVTTIRGGDPDLGNSGDGHNFPSMRSYSLGINITF